VYFETAKNDTIKKNILIENGFIATDIGHSETDEFTISTIKYTR
jgi:hypothetical protein